MGTAQPFRPTAEVVNGAPGRGLPQEQPTHDRMAYLNQTASLRNYGVLLQGGSSKTRYYIGGGYSMPESLWKPMSFDRVSFKLNLDQKLIDKITRHQQYAYPQLS